MHNYRDKNLCEKLKVYKLTKNFVHSKPEVKLNLAILETLQLHQP